MCGRYTLSQAEADLIVRFQVQELLFHLEPRYNVAPTQFVPIVRESENGRLLEGARWGLVPSWAKDPSIGYKMINARSESVAEKPAFKTALRKRRCIIPSDGFYEWLKVGKSKIPHRFTLQDGAAFGFAGLWEGWKQPDGEWMHSCTIITTTANELVQPIHDRMPVILTPQAEDDWLTAPADDVPHLLQMLQPYPAEKMAITQVTTAVNSSAAQGAELIQPTYNSQ